MKKRWAGVVIVVVAVFLRVWRLDQVPVELFGDELDVGYHAYSILKTGKDYLGHSWPVMFASFAENRLPFLIYWTVPFIKVFGLNEWGVRLPAAALGLISLVGLALLARRLFDQRVAMIAALLLAISPWHIQFSRWSSDNIGILVWVTFGVWLLIARRWLGAAIVLALAFYSYSIAVVFIPLLVLVAMWSYRLWLGRKWQPAAALGVVVLLPFVWAVISGSVAGRRFSQISVFTDQSILHEVVTRRSSTPSEWTRWFRNRPAAYIEEIARNYFQSFSTEFLLFSGDPILRHSVANMGELYLFEVVTVAVGIAWAVRHWRESQSKLVLGWLLVAPLAAALTKDGGNHAGRLVVMLPPLVMLSALGISSLLPLWSRRWGKIFLTGLLLLATLNFGKYLYRHYVEWPRDSWRFWAQGYKEAIQFIKAQDGSLTRVYFNSTYEPALPRFLFWYGYDPALFQAQYAGGQWQKEITPGFEGFKLGEKYYFGTLADKTAERGFARLVRPGEWYLASQRDEIGTGTLSGVKIEATIVNPANQPIFMILSKPDI